jgi:hypothetical protein
MKAERDFSAERRMGTGVDTDFNLFLKRSVSRYLT